jgi:hypothetical protein
MNLLLINICCFLALGNWGFSLLAVPFPIAIKKASSLNKMKYKTIVKSIKKKAENVS